MKMKNVLLFTGIAVVIGSVFFYIKRQIDLALKYDYKITGLKIIKNQGGVMDLELKIQLTNRSNFGLAVNHYNLNFYYNNELIGNSVYENADGSAPIIVPPDRSFEITGYVTIDTNKLGQLSLQAVKAIINQQPIVFQVDGMVNVDFMGITRTINIERTDYVYSENLLAEYGLDDDVERLKNKVEKWGLKIF